MSDVKQVLENLGYKVIQDGMYYYRARPIYRDSGNSTSLRISRKSGWFTDFSAGRNGPLSLLVQLTLGLKNLSEAKGWLSNHEFDSSGYSEEKPIIVGERSYPKELLEKLVKIHTYWEGRGIPVSVLDKFQGGVSVSGTMAGRYIFPISDEHDRLVGFAGRDTTGKNLVKWLLVGDKMKWAYPLSNHSNIQSSREVVLVESIGDLLSLERAGIHNALVLFGVNIPDKIISTLVRLNPSKIIIATNNDADNEFVGNKAAKEIKQRLEGFFNPDSVIIHLPKTKNDFGDMTDVEIHEWHSALESLV